MTSRTSLICCKLTTVLGIKNGVVSVRKAKSRALTICIENPEIPARIQMERFIPVKFFRKKSNTFRGITKSIAFFPFLLERPKFYVPFVWI